MVHPVTIKQSQLLGADQQTQQRLEYFIELWYVVACILFCIGSFYFVMDNENAVRPGCKLFDVGSIMFAAGSVLYMIEGVYFEERERRSHRSQRMHSCVWRLLKSEYIDQLFYCLGSLVFLVGTLIWDPDLAGYFLAMGGVYVSRLAWLKIADLLFMIGSFGFSFASFLSALNIYREHELFKEQAVIITSCYQFGGFFFIAGTMSYVPGYNCSREFEVLGGCLYLVGSLLYLLGCLLSFLKRVATYQAATEHLAAAGTIQDFVRRYRQSSGLRRCVTALRGTDGSSPRRGDSPNSDQAAARRTGSSDRTSQGQEHDLGELSRHPLVLEAVLRFQEVGWARQRRRRDVSPTGTPSPSLRRRREFERIEFRTLLRHALWPSSWTPPPRDDLATRFGVGYAFPSFSCDPDSSTAEDSCTEEDDSDLQEPSDPADSSGRGASWPPDAAPRPAAATAFSRRAAMSQVAPLTLEP
mmetsp:Transcript_116875/g.337714  ORF Transcript_116875/g.337714 Transcript_116875/m.337714 type:complete len:469 (-) Transcript_116875:111-1517(-)